jgi:hypothetical protein
MRRRPAFEANCFQGYMDRVDDIMATEGVVVAECHLGMLMFGAPLKVEGQVLGALGGCAGRARSGADRDRHRHPHR